MLRKLRFLLFAIRQNQKPNSSTGIHKKKHFFFKKVFSSKKKDNFTNELLKKNCFKFLSSLKHAAQSLVFLSILESIVFIVFRTDYEKKIINSLCFRKKHL